MIEARRPAATSGSKTMAAGAAASRHPAPINLAIGEPAEPLPDFLAEACRRALAEGRTRYDHPAGLAALRDALASEQSARDGVARSAENVMVTAGAKPALLDALRVLIEPGEEVLVLAPYWPTYLDQVRACRGVPVVVPADEHHLPTAAAIEAAIGPRTRAVMVNSPNNPSGRVWPAALLAEIGALAARHGLWVLSDQAYLDLEYSGRAPTLLETAPDLVNQSVIETSFSKRFSMTGLRLGGAIGPRDLIASMTDLASTATTHPNTLAQHTGLAALAEPRAWLEEQRARYRRRHGLALAALRSIPGVEAAPADAALFLLPRVEGLMAARGVASDVDLSRWLAEEVGVRVVPGSLMGAPGHVRVSLGAQDTALVEALERWARS